MNEKLEQLFTAINFDQENWSFFNSAELKKATYFQKEDKLYIEVEVDYILKIDTYKKLYECIKDFNYQRIMFIFKVNHHLYNKELITSYYNYFLEEYLLDDTNDYLKMVNLEYKDECIIFNFVNDGMLMLFEKFKRKIEYLFRIAGFSIPIYFEISENEEVSLKIDDLTRTKDKVIDLDSIVKTKTQEYNDSNNVQTQKRVMYRKSQKDLSNFEVMKIESVYEEMPSVCLEGYVFSTDILKTKNNFHIQTIKLTDFSDSILLKRFEGRGLTLEDMELVKPGTWVKVLGDVKYDTFANEHVLFLQAVEIVKSKEIIKYDTSNEKRVELHAHTKMSVMDGIASVNDYVKAAMKYGHTAIAITDHNNIQAYPDAQNAVAGSDFKIIYGLENNVINDKNLIVENSNNNNIDELTYVFFDLETTGLYAYYEEIIEIGATKYKNGMEVDTFQCFIKPKKEVSLFTKELTGITDYDLMDGLELIKGIEQFMEFCKDSVLIAHNATFDVSFINMALTNYGYPKLTNPIIDTLLLSRRLDTKRRNHTLGACAKAYQVEYDTNVAHRADYDAYVLSRVYQNMEIVLKEEYQIKTLDDINKLCDKDFFIRQRPNHLNILVKNQKGLKDLFYLVSMAHTDYFYNEPILLKSLIDKRRSNLLIGSGCLNGDVFNTALTSTDDELKEVMSYYDYIEVWPYQNLTHLVDLNHFDSIEIVKEVIKRIIKVAKSINKLVVATGDVHYINESDHIYRDVYVNAMGIGGKIHPLFDRRNRIKETPMQHFRTTQEMLDCFDFLDEATAKEIVITNTNKIADMIEEVKPIKDRLYTPHIEGVDQMLSEMCYENAYKMYGNPLPDIVRLRLEKELESIIKHGFAVVYYISSQLVVKSLEDGYLVGSRGSVGSSLVATLSNITEVNPLVAHYYCPNCQYSEFFDDGSVSSGYDLVDKLCPKCNQLLKGDGQDIPFETFLGFEGDKVPDIDLNFSGDYQAVAHNYTKELFGEDHVFRAGTISTVQTKTAFGYAKGFHEKNFSLDKVRNTELERLALGCEGVKRTTGQHPGGIIVIPENMDVYDFTPVNFPADDVNSTWKTTHFDFHAIHDNVLKLDILGHVDPTAIRMLQDLTGIDPKSIPTNDQKVLSLFSSNEALGIEHLVDYKNAAIGIPEFGTSFVRKMLENTNPKSFAELVQISGLSHGTDVWTNNAEDLIKRGICTLKDVIGCRDDIMVYLMYNGIEPKLAFTIMESVRKGKGLKEEWIKEMKLNNIPEWYIESCIKIKYMFPKAHAAAYVLMATRVAYFKVYYPLEYYATYFTTRCDQFDIVSMTKGIDVMKSIMAETEAKGYEASAKEGAIYQVFEVCIEMYYRGYKVLPISIDKSDATQFVVDHENKALIPPFSSIDGLGENVARSVIKAREEGYFLSKEDLEKRTQLNKNHILFLERLGSISHLQEYNQTSLF